MRCLGLDIGSSSIKGAVLDLDERTIGGIVSRPFPPPVAGLPAGWIEISPHAIVELVEQVLAELLAAVPDASQLYCCGQMGGVALVSETGEPLANYISWRDQRTLQKHGRQSYLEAVRTRWTDALGSLGNELQPGSATTLLYWLSQQDSLPTQAIPTTVADGVISHLCSVPPRMHETHAIGMLDLHTSHWHHAALDAIGLGHVHLPELSHQVGPAGHFNRQGRTITVYGAFGDQQTALCGAGLNRGELSLNVSTGSQVGQRTARFHPGQYQTRKYFGGDWLNTVTHLPAGRSLNALVDLLTELAREEGITLENPWDTIIRKAGEIEANDLQLDLAFFAGPLGNSGSISHVTTENITVGHLFHAAFRAMAENYARCASWLDPERRWNSVVLSGGLTQSVPVLRAMIQQRFDLPLRESSGEETLLGLLELASVAA